MLFGHSILGFCELLFDLHMLANLRAFEMRFIELVVRVRLTSWHFLIVIVHGGAQKNRKTGEMGQTFLKREK